jgi:hypothetical protein
MVDVPLAKHIFLLKLRTVLALRNVILSMSPDSVLGGVINKKDFF